MDPESFTQKAKSLAEKAQEVAEQANALAGDAGQILTQAPPPAAISATTMITEEIALVTDMSGECSAGVTRQTT